MKEFLKELKELLNKHNMEVGYYERQECLWKTKPQAISSGLQTTKSLLKAWKIF